MKEKDRVSIDYLRGLVRAISLDLTEGNLAKVVGYSLSLRASQEDRGKGVKLTRKERAGISLEK